MSILVVACFLAILFFIDTLFRRIKEYQEENRARLARLDAILKPATRCPTCGHPVMSAPFCDGLMYVCPDCADTFVWVLDAQTGFYRLTTQEPIQESAQT